MVSLTGCVSFAPVMGKTGVIIINIVAAYICVAVYHLGTHYIIYLILITHCGSSMATITPFHR